MTNSGPGILHASNCTAGSPAAGIRQGARLRIVPPEITASERQRGANLSRLPSWRLLRSRRCRGSAAAPFPGAWWCRPR